MRGCPRSVWRRAHGGGFLNTEYLLKNGTIPDDLVNFAEKFYDETDEFLFVIVSDLSADGGYGSSAIFVSASRLCTVGETYDGGGFAIDFADIESVCVKRMYGNAIMSAKLTGGTVREILRFTFSVAELCESCAEYINKVKSGEPAEVSLEAVRSTFRNQSSFCPKCGRRLLSPDAECLNCKGKKSLMASLAKYIRPHICILTIGLILSVLTTACSLIPPYITSRMVDDIIPNKNTRLLAIIVISLIFVYFIQIALGGVRSYLLRIAGNRIVGDLKKEVYEKAQYLPMKFYDKTSTGAVITRVNSDTVILQQFMLNVSQNAVVQLFTLVGILVMMLIMNWKLTIFSLIPVPIVVYLSKKLHRLLGPRYRRLWRRNATISAVLTDTIPAIRVVKSFSKEERTVINFTDRVDNMLEEDRKLGRVVVLIPALINFLIMLGSSLIWLFGGRMVIFSPTELSLGILVSFITYTQMFYAPVNFFATFGDSYQNAIASAERIFDIINAEPEHDFGHGFHPDIINGKIEFRRVNFSFDRSKKVLSDISFVIEPGDVVGIVGTTGSGKSTLINLLMRFYDDYDGDIFVDGINIRDIDLAFYRDQIGYVQQEPVMFKDTIFNNIAYSKPDATPEEVINVADIANAHGFISRLPDAYDTMLGERGIGLSGGEKQRLSIARAVLKNPAVMIFDEATSAVDSETEKLIQDAIDNIIYGRTTLMIAHRLSTLRKANKIIVVDNGKIIEFGSPEELLAMKGKYYKLIKIQSMSEEAESIRKAERFD